MHEIAFGFIARYLGNTISGSNLDCALYPSHVFSGRSGMTQGRMNIHKVCFVDCESNHCVAAGMGTRRIDPLPLISSFSLPLHMERNIHAITKVISSQLNQSVPQNG